ncbi:MAG: protein kinase [Gemmatimonadaceae bacterium]|nr:protein kinase [Gemmatimonadaceae bacterium]
MAQLIPSPMGGGPVNEFELAVVQNLVASLPAGYVVIPNFALRDQQGRAYEYDVVVLAPHAVYVVEAKEWYGRISGDDAEWLLNGKPRKCPLWLADQKGKVLKSRTGIYYGLWVEPLLVVPDGIGNDLHGNWARSLLPLSNLAGTLQDRHSVPHPSSTPLPHGEIKKALLGNWQARQAQGVRRFGSYEVVETLAQDEKSGEYIARHAMLGGDDRFRVRTWHVDPYTKPEEQRRTEEIIRRPAEALQRIPRHPNLLPILAFDRDAETNDFYEVTDWSAFGTLHGYLRHSDRQHQLTVRERLEIAAGVASALEAVHAAGLVHRNVCPETIVVGFDRQPRLTDFDRAFIDRTATVFPQTTNRQRNLAYLPPELSDPNAYDFETGSDMYSFGVLLFDLLANAVPFENPDRAIKANGKPPALPSQLRVGVDTTIDTLVLDLLRVDDFNARPTAAYASTVLRAALRGTSAARSAGAKESEAPAPATPLPDGRFAVGSVVNGNLRVDAELGGGAFSRVYRVLHLDQQRTFAMKLLTRPEDADVLLSEFNKVGRFLPKHPHIAQLRWMDRLAPPIGTPYILSEYVAGETLEKYCSGDRPRLALSQVQEIGLALLDALSALHGDPILQSEGGKGRLPDVSASNESLRDDTHVFFHRDIKPANVMLEQPSGQPKLIDFNIAARADEASGRGGTPRYWAPDRGKPTWQANADLFSLGVVLYELVTQHHPFQDDRPENGAPYDVRAICPDVPISDAFAQFLLKAVQPQAADRFATAREMWAALKALPTLHKSAGIESVPAADGTAEFPGVTLAPWEIGKPNYNPYVTRLQTLYSQARRTNSGTRGLDQIARLTYVPTRLDEKLAPAIADGKFRLVVVTGNAGDGKTAFLQQVEQYFARELGAEVARLQNGNGSRWSHEGLAFETNYDGSQDEGDLESDAVLARFFSPFADDVQAALAGSEVRLIAINEGRLLDFLDHGAEHARFGGLREQIKRALGEESTLPGLLVVNLNLRAVAAGGRDSLVERQLQQLLHDQLWAPCEGCALKARCPLRHNALSMRDQASGRAVRERVRRLFEVVHLRRRQHVTMRDLRSALSWLLLRDHGCDDVAKLLKQLDSAGSEADERRARHELIHLAYPAAFMAGESLQRETTDDRLVRLLREADVGLVDDPRLDRRLDADSDSAVPWLAFDQRPSYQRELLQTWASVGPRTVEEGAPADVLRARRRVIAMWRRWAYYERRDGGWSDMLPYRSLDLLERILQSRTVEERDAAALLVRNRVVEAVSLSEGLRHPMIRERYLALRVSRIKDPTAKSYRLFGRDEFRVLIGSRGQAADYLESAPDAVELRPTAHADVASLRIPLDLLEMLELIRQGYRPSPADLQGLFVNLVIFRNELLNLPFDRVLLTQDDETLYELSGGASPEGTIQLDLRRVDDAALTGIASGGAHEAEA